MYKDIENLENAKGLLTKENMYILHNQKEALAHIM